MGAKHAAWMASLALVTALGMSACGDDVPIDMPDAMHQPTLDELLAQVVQEQELAPLPAKPVMEPALVSLGQALFFDKELSGNRDISCATCHHPLLDTGDALSLPVGTGGEGLGPDRVLGAGRRLVPRNAPEIFNRGYAEWTSMFWDSRVASTADGFTTPAGASLLASVDSLTGAQAMFPPTSRDEMRGADGDLDVNGNPNELAMITDGSNGAIWSALIARVMAIPEYREMFASAYPGVSVEDIDFGHAANAIGAFEVDAFTFTESPWDRYLRGEMTALSDPAKRGALLFYDKAGCGSCHSGMLFTDQEHRVVASPQIGPGKDPSGDDFGRYGVTRMDEDRYAFRTPPLRNVTITGPWFHAGAYTTLEGAVRHYLDAASALRDYDVAQLAEAVRGEYYDDQAAIEDRIARLDPSLQMPIELSPEEFADLMDFLAALTDPAAEALEDRAPAIVPSGLPLD